MRGYRLSTGEELCRDCFKDRKLEGAGLRMRESGLCDECGAEFEETIIVLDLVD